MTEKNHDIKTSTLCIFSKQSLNNKNDDMDNRRMHGKHSNIRHLNTTEVDLKGHLFMYNQQPSQTKRHGV